MKKEFLLHKDEKEKGKPAHIQAHLAAQSHRRLLSSQKSLHFAYASKITNHAISLVDKISRNSLDSCF